MCGDARDNGAYEALLGSERVDLIFTDPPYNVPIDGHVCGSGRIRHREFAMGVGEMSSPEFRAFLERTLGPAAAQRLGLPRRQQYRAKSDGGTRDASDRQADEAGR